MDPGLWEGLIMRALWSIIVLGSVYVLFTLGCGTHDLRRDCVMQGNNCQGPSGSPGRDGSPGTEGIQGNSGRDGKDGTDGATGPNGADGPAGQQGIPGEQGATGPQGIPGAIGPSGADGYSLVSTTETVAENDYFCPNGGLRIRIARDINRNDIWDSTDTNQQISSVCNGIDGEAGQDGSNGQDAPVSPFLPVSIVDPCGDKPGIYDEVFIRMQNGTLLASFSDNSNGQNTRFSILSSGSYVTTDGSHCYFSIDSQGVIQNEHY